jgi:aspartate carbamoyltransferase regulatory subunit
VNWKIKAPWYREVHDGLNWFGYCKNRNCVTFEELFVVNRGYGIFKLEQELAEFSCPVCMETHFDLSNMGFVNCEWALKGQLRTSS